VPTYRLVVEYDGSAYHGLQYQPAPLRTIAGELEAALSRIFREPVKITAAGRTDAGVHATAQVISFRAERDFPAERLALAVNGNTPPDLRVVDVAQVADAFSARFDALERSYDYLILNTRFPSALWRERAWFVIPPLDDVRLAEAARPLIGQHDFVSFCGELPERGGTERTLNAIDVERRGEHVRLTVRGRGFLHHMVRVIVGTLVDSATTHAVGFAAEALAARDRRAAGTTAPAHGLYLTGVRYPDFAVSRPVSLAP
jgi:tRNA pseudouridine38-40 synthase